MALLGLLLLAAAAGLGIDVVAQNGATMTVDALGRSFSMTPGSLFLAGCATATVASVGLLLMHDGVVRMRRRRMAASASRQTTIDLVAERDALATQLESERLAREGAGQIGPIGGVPLVDLPAAEGHLSEEQSSDQPVLSRLRRR